MLSRIALQRLPIRPLTFTRSNATLQKPSPSLKTAPKPLIQVQVAQKATVGRTSTAGRTSSSRPSGTSELAGGRTSRTKAKKRRRGLKTGPMPRRRPDISIFNPREWNRPLEPGILRAYDLALKLIEKDSKTLKLEAADIKKTVVELEREGAEAEQLSKLKDKLRIIEIQSEINLPSVRWRCANGMADLTKPVDRHLVQQRWRTEGTLDLLMERLHQMHVIPDVVPDCHPSIDLRVSVLTPIDEQKRTRRAFKELIPGEYISPHQTKSPPNLYADIFHVDTRLYTMFMVDPDVPDPENQSYRTYLHWLQPNIPLSATKRTRIGSLNQHTKYIPPHPQQGSPYHRYCIFLLEQPSKEPIDVPTISKEARERFDPRQFMGKYGLNPTKGGGASMFRQIWSDGVKKAVTEIYEKILRTPQPKFGRPPLRDEYADMQNVKKYGY